MNLALPQAMEEYFMANPVKKSDMGRAPIPHLMGEYQAHKIHVALFRSYYDIRRYFIPRMEDTVGNRKEVWTTFLDMIENKTTFYRKREFSKWYQHHVGNPLEYDLRNYKRK